MIIKIIQNKTYQALLLITTQEKFYQDKQQKMIYFDLDPVQFDPTSLLAPIQVSSES